jgi:ATP-dependent helicase/nuclease subunit B
MRVALLIGPAGSGKTHRCMEALRDAERASRRALLLVPDQFTYAADRLLLGDPSLPGTRFVRVASFRRLVHLLAQRRAAPRLLSEQGRRMLLRRIVDGAPDEVLGPFARVRARPGFVDALALTVREIKGIAGAEAAEQLAAAAGEHPKVAALARLLQAYDTAISEAGLTDPEESAHRIAREIGAASETWTDGPVWVDGFASFTPTEKVLLQAVGSVAGQLTITLCCHPADAETALAEAERAADHGLSPIGPTFATRLRERLERPLFLPTVRTLLWLQGAFPAAPEVTYLKGRPHRFRLSPPLAAIEAALFASRQGGAKSAPEDLVRVRSYPHPYREVVGWARTIDRWTRLADEPIRHRDITLLVRDLEIYRPLIREVFERYGLPVFVDQRRDASAHPLVRLCLSAVEIASRGWSRANVIALLRNPILGTAAETVDRIENLSLEYGIEYERWWETSWDALALPDRERIAPTRGYEETTEEEPESDAGEEGEEGEGFSRRTRDEAKMRRRMLAAEEARQTCGRAFPALRTFAETWREGGAPFANAVDALRTLVGTYAGAGEPHDALPRIFADREFAHWSAEETHQVAALLDEVSATGVELMGSIEISPRLFARLLKEAVAGASIGLTPRILDAVTVAEPRRSRVNEARRVILGGLDSGSFPRSATQDPLLSDEERERLAGRGLPLAQVAIPSAEEDLYLFYIACTRARERLVVTYPRHAAGGAVADPSPYLGELLRAVSAETRALVEERGEVSPLTSCQQPGELPAHLATALRAAPQEPSTLAAEVTDRVPGTEEIVARSLQRVERVERPLPERLATEVVRQLFPRTELRTSASRLETFAKCPFMHFAQHVLHLQPRPEAALTPLSTGSAAHRALEHFFTQPAAMPEEADAPARMRAIFRRLAEDEEFRIFQVDPPSAYRWQRTGHNLELFVQTELRRLAQSGFRPRALELSFGLPVSEEERAALLRALCEGNLPPEGRLPALEIELDPGAVRAAGLPEQSWRVLLRGRIDRLDVGEGREALVIDYKQGKQERPMEKDLDRGLGLQVATYLLAVRDLLGLTPAAGLYYSFRPLPHSTESSVASGNVLQFGMRGIFLAPAKAKIDPEGAFLPKKAAGLETGGMDAVLARLSAQIQQLSLGILSGTIRPYPVGPQDQLPCRYCEYGSVCRFDPDRHPIRPPSAEEPEAVEGACDDAET